MLLWSGAAWAQPALAMPQRHGEALLTGPFSIDELIALARRESYLLQAAQAQALASRAGVVSARAYPNPELELLAGSFRPRVAGGTSGSGSSFAISQRIENPRLRDARSAVAGAAVQSAEINVSVVENNLVALIKERFFESLRREEERDVAREELALTEQIRERIAVRTRTGEGARFDLIRADNEVAIASKNLELAIAGVAEARALLKQLVSPRLADNFTLAGDFYRSTPQADYASLRDAVLSSNPELRRALAETVRAERAVDVERQSVLPSLALRLVQDTEPDVRSTRAGVAVNLPLWDRRRGPIDEARANVIRNRSEAELKRFALAQDFEAIWRRYQAALAAVQALEGGIIRQARQVVDIAEAAFRFGERGILEYLDARRQFRLVRAELIQARFDLYAAKTELERLAARDIKGE
ncbi:MAG: TolC family protein [Burkholderiales bacterium]